MTWIEADILDINLTPNQYNALVPAIVSSVMTSQSHLTQWCHNITQRTLLWAHVNGTEIVLKSTDRRPFNSVTSQ